MGHHQAEAAHSDMSAERDYSSAMGSRHYPATMGAQGAAVPYLHVVSEGFASASTLPVVLSHPLGLDLSTWDAIARHLSKSREVLRYDHRGHGASAVPPGPYSMKDLVDDAERVVQQWGRGPVVWIGLSMGAMVGQGLALRNPSLIAGLVLANATAKWPPEISAAWAPRIAAVESGGMSSIVDMLINRFYTEEYRASDPAFIAAAKKIILKTDPRGYISSCQAVASVNWESELSTINCKTLVIAGGKDFAAPPELSRMIAQKIPGAELVLLENASHLSVNEAPEKFSRAVDVFIETLESTKD